MIDYFCYLFLFLSLHNFSIVQNTNAVSDKLIIRAPTKSSKDSEPDSVDKVDKEEWKNLVPHEDAQKPEILHIPIPSRKESQDCECGFKYPIEVIKTNDFGEEMPVVENDQPWQVWITFLTTSKTKTRYDVKCGGSLINDKFILTNAPCVEPFRTNSKAAEFLWEKRRVNVRLGDKSLKSDPSSIGIAEVIFHPEYLAGNMAYQAALLRLESPVNFQIPDGVRPVCLPGIYEHFQMGRDGVLIKLKVEEINAKAYEERIPHNEDYNSLYSTYDCQRIYERLDNETSKIHHCAGVKSNYTEKYFGIPMMIEMANTQLLQVGVLSSLYFKEKTIANTTANLFIKIVDLLPFIDENSAKSGATWCKHAVMKFNDSAPVSRIVGEAWLGTKSTGRLENPACDQAKQYNKDELLEEGILFRMATLVSETYKNTTFQRLANLNMHVTKQFLRYDYPCAHCIFDHYKAVNPETAEMIPVTDTANVKLRILAHLTDNDEKSKIMEVKTIHIHPEYVEDFKLGYQDYDVALLELKEPLDFWNPNGPLPVCILSSEDNLDLVGRMGTVIGWGMTEIDDPTSGASALQQLNVPIQPLEKCKVLSVLEVTDRFICAGTFNPQRDTLHGDSGGPLMVETVHNRMLQIGVVSWGDLERRKTEGLYSDIAAAMYTNVSKAEILSYIDYFSKKSDARWCKKSFFGPNPRRPWEGRRNAQKIVNPDCVCGMPDQSEPDEKNPTSEFPWTVLVIKLDRPGTISYCMGTIINTLFVLTSANCLRSSEKVQIHLRPTIHHKKIRIQTIQYETEVVNLNSTSKILKAAAVHINSDFLALEGENRLENNIGLIRLEKPLTFTNRRKQTPVCLPSAWEASDFVGTEAMVTGWRRTSVGKRKQVTLEVLDEKIIPTERCGKIQRLGINKDFICTESKNPTVPVKITDGGSVTVDMKNSQIIQIGVMSHFGLMSPNRKRRYANVKDSLGFIEYFSHEAKASWCQRVAPSKKDK